MIESLLSVVPPRTRASFYRTAGGAEVDLVLEVPGFQRPFAIEIKRGLAPSLGRGFREALADLVPERAFVIYGGSDRYPVAEKVEVIGVTEMARLLADPQGLR